jgi:aminoglycoside phosphotransferase (APT) family kinase protein
MLIESKLTKEDAKMDQFLKSMIEELIGEIQNDDLLSEQGWTSQVRRLVTSNGLYLLKSSFDERYRNWLKTEAQVLEKLSSESEIPMPQYFGFFQEENSSHLIMSFEEGITLTAALRNAASESERKSLFASFGHFLQQFHEMNLNEKLEHDHDWLEEQLVRAQHYVNKGQAEGSQELLDSLKMNKPSQVKQTMIHGDCTTDNVLVVAGKVCLFIDVAGMTVGDPRYDESLAIREIIDNPEYLEAFYEGYRRYRVTKEEFHYFDDGLYEFF